MIGTVGMAREGFNAVNRTTILTDEYYRKDPDVKGPVDRVLSYIRI